jgi:hypothetical protein
MKIKIISDDGSIQGWFVSFLITFLRLGIYVANYLVPGFSDTEQKIGPAFTSFCLLSVGSWFTYKIVKPLTSGGETK